MKKFFFVALLLASLGSCKKEGISPAIVHDEAPSSIINDSSVSTGGQKIFSSNILNATNASQIPSQMFAVNQIYKDSYVHLKQRPEECSWTSYVMCVGSVARANGRSYSTSLGQVTTVRDKCVQHAGSYENGKAVDQLDWYAGAWDNAKITRQLVPIVKTNQFGAIKQMLAHINNYHTPFVVRSSLNGGGHYRVVFSIDWKVGQTGSTVYYTDCNLPAGVPAGIPTNSGIQSNIQSMDFTQFLSLMIVGANNYNMLFIKP